MKQKILAIISFIMIILVFIVSCGKKEEKNGIKKKYLIATDSIYAPFEFQENGKYVGIDIDIIDAISKLEGFEYELKPMDFGGIIAALQSGQIDGAIAGATITEERKKAVDFSDSYYEKGLVAVVNKENTSISKAADLEGKKLAIKNGTAGADYVNENLKGKSEIRVYEDTVSMFKAVENGQADAAFEDLPVIEYSIKTTPDTKLKVGTEKLTVGYYGFMVKKGENSELLDKFNSGLKKIRENGEYDKILAKYK